MIPKQDRQPEPGREKWRKFTVTESNNPAVPVGLEFSAEVSFDDNSPVDGTPVNRASEIEYLAASGTTTGTASVFNLAQEDFALFDGALIRVKFHTNTVAPFTINTNFTGAIPVYNAQGINTVNYNANTIGTFAYSATLNRWIAQGAGTEVINNLTSTSTTAALSVAQGKVLNDTKANLASPALTGTPTVPTAATATNNTQIASTAFVQANIATRAPINHANAAVTYGGGTNANYGHVRLSDSVSSTSGATASIAATPAAINAVKTTNAIGTGALAAGSTGSANVAMGYRALYSVTSGWGNVALGSEAGVRQVGSQNTFIGNTAGWTADNSNYNNSIAIGNTAITTASNQITLGNNEITQLRCQVQTISTLSDARLKEDISPADIEKCLESVKALPVTRYKYKDFTGTHLDTHVTGWMADDVERVFPKAVQKTDEHYPELDKKGNKIYETDENGEQREKKFTLKDVKSITMTEALPTLWGAVQALIERVEYLEKERETMSKEKEYA